MSGSDDELCLSLSLGFGVTTQPSFIHRPSNSMINHLRRSSWKDAFQVSDRNVDSRSFLRGIDVNRLRTAVDGEEENGVSSPNSTVSSISGKRSEREAVGDEAEAERTSCSRGSDDEDGGDGDGDASRKKLRLSKEQSLVLEETFKEHNTLNPVSGNLVISYDSSLHVALMISGNFEAKAGSCKTAESETKTSGGVVSKQKGKVSKLIPYPGVESTKLKQTEVDCEYLRRCCENLTEENRRLQKEVQELRALKLSPQLYMHMNPPTTLTMCPQCERVAVSSFSSTSAASTRHPVAAGMQQRSSMPIAPQAVLPIQR
ncbi:Homeobox-leucine zipper protein HAT3, partial [Cucurbita argyrosperma subsp. argyrosperma]